MNIQPLKIRISTWNDEAILLFLTKYAVRYVYVKEHVNNENHHTHLYIETVQSEVSIRAYIRRAFGSGNSSYSMAKLDSLLPMEYLRYLCKQDTLKHNFLTNEQIEEYKNLDLQVKEEIKEAKEKRKKNGSKAIIADLRTIIADQASSYDEVVRNGEKFQFPLKKDKHGYEEYFSNEDIVLLVLDYYRVNKLLVREFQVVSQVQTLLLEFTPGYKCSLAHRILDRI